MKRLHILALGFVGAALGMPACATSRPVARKEVTWMEAKLLLAESKKLAPATAPVRPAAEKKRETTVAASTPVSPSRSAPRDRFHPARTTAYFHGEDDHLAYGRKSAVGSELAFGAERSAAADWSRYPLGTRFRIIGDHQDCEYRIDDYGSALVGTNTIDLYRPTRGAMNAWGCREVVIEVLEWGCFEKSLRIMEDRTHSSHVRRMVEAIREAKSAPATPELAAALR